MISQIAIIINFGWHVLWAMAAPGGWSMIQIVHCHGDLEVNNPSICHLRYKGFRLKVASLYQYRPNMNCAYLLLFTVIACFAHATPVPAEVDTDDFMSSHLDDYHSHIWYRK